MACNIIWLVYDGIAHSVFAGQVIAPAVQLCEHNPNYRVTIITFEKNIPSSLLIHKYNAKHPHLKLVVMRRIPFLGVLSLYFARYQLKKFLNNFESYELKARGPLAGWLAIHSSNRNQCSHITIQARGLLAEEYRYRYGKTSNILAKVFHHWRHRSLEVIEQDVYNSGCDIEAITSAMKDYLINSFNADSNRIFLAQEDIPPKIQPAQVAQWRISIRHELNIPFQASVYCFIGSIKVWQKPDMVIQYFKEQLAQDSTSMLLLLTEDIQLFTAKLIDYNVPLTHVRILSVAHDDIYKYLSVADKGLLFRDKHPLSFVARPVKAMEYQSVGLEIVHNGTVDWLNHHSNHHHHFLHQDANQVDQ
jgi:hypothetical protein